LDLKTHHNNLLIFGLQFPEPKSTAAGSRMVQLIDLFKEFGYHVHFACAQPPHEFSIDLEKIQVKTEPIQLNDPHVKKILRDIQPQIVVFDRFITEEQFGWMVDDVCPDALKILDTEDLHFLRENREALIKNPESTIDEFDLTDKAKREIGAIFRCDMTLMISKVEIEILVNKLKLPKDLLCYLPFIINNNEVDNEKKPDFAVRRHFISIGNFKHAPNLDMVKHLHKKIWLKIRSEIQDAEWHIYGAYLPQQIREISNKKQGIIVKGRAEDALQTLKNYRVMLAPLRFGAGLKGKCIDSMLAGTPSVTTSIGAEGIAEHKDWPGFVEDDEQKFVNASVELYQNQNIWQDKQKKAFEVLNQNFSKMVFRKQFQEHLKYGLSHLKSIRKNNLTGQLLKYHLHRSTKFMSLWIEEKNKKR
jgi:glycosyltransferase involved in cell wall biosynthesis